MINTICHLADIHIRKIPSRNDEYEKVFENLISSLKLKKPDRIVIVGDLVHDYLDLQGEQLILAANFLNNLAEIAPVRITRGNHDCRKKNLNRVDSISAIVKTLNNPKIIYYGKTGFYDDDNVVWAVWHHGDVKNNPWKSKEGKLIIDNPSHSYTIDLFHDPINGCKSVTGFEMKSKSFYKTSEFKGELSLFGDIHRMQFLDDKMTKAYAGSLIAQDFGEGDYAFHGYLLWDLEKRVAELVPIESDYSFKNIKITPYTDFEDLDYEIDNPTPNMKIRFIWMTLPQTRTKENERKLAQYFRTKYGSVKLSHKNEFIENEKIEVKEDITLQNITNPAVQHEIFREYFEKIGVDSKMIEDIIALDDEVCAEIDLDGIDNIEWNIVKFGGNNFMSYGKLDVDWRDMDGLFQITGINTAGKTTIMKLITYILFGKTLETETRVKFGDHRFVNNRNGAKYCDGYLVLEANGEYYGIRKKTEINRNKSGEITGAPTTLSYYVLSNPDEEMDANTSIEKLDSDKRIKTQQKLEAIIGDYDNFMRIVMTTSDTLNRILSNDMAVFIDSLLFDSGLDIFDKKLEGLKSYLKKFNDQNRINVDVDKLTLQNINLAQEIVALESDVANIENVLLPDAKDKINRGKDYLEQLTKKLFKIDSEIYTLNIDDVKATINIHQTNINQLVARNSVLSNSISVLKDTYDVDKLNSLIEQRELHKTSQFNKKMEIKNFEQQIRDEEHNIEILNGDVLRLKQDGARLKNEITDLKNSKVCSQCGQDIKKKEHIDHIVSKVQIKEQEMFGIAEKIKNKENVEKKAIEKIITEKKAEVLKIQQTIDDAALAMESVLVEIGKLNNDKNDVERRKELQTELDQLPTKVQNEELKISLLQQKVDNYENSLKQIEENKKIEKGIYASKVRISELENVEQDLKEDLLLKKSAIGEKNSKILVNNQLMTAFAEQEYRDSVISLYKKCVHRDGIPKQILSMYIIPKINLSLANILSVSQFKVWLDEFDLRPKLAYHNRPDAIIDCISASGKERTFSSVVLKFALNQINVKSKPMMFLLDEVMGKLDLMGSVEEFNEILQMIKLNMKKVLVVEQVHEINPDYLISVSLDENDISSLVIE